MPIINKVKSKFNSIFSKMNLILNQQKKDAHRIYFKKPNAKSIFYSLSLVLVITVFLFQYILISDKANSVIPSIMIRTSIYFGVMMIAALAVILFTNELFVKVVLAISQPLAIIGITSIYFSSGNMFFYLLGVICFSLGCGASFGTAINLFFYSFDMSERLITSIGLVIFIFSYSFFFKIPATGIVRDFIIPAALLLVAYISTILSQDLLVIDRKPEIIPKYSFTVLILLILIICINLGLSSIVLNRIHPNDISFYKSYYSYTFFIGFIICCFVSIGIFLFAKKALLQCLVIYFIVLLGSYLFTTFNILYNPELGYRNGVIFFRQISDIGFGFSTAMGFIIILMLSGKILDDKVKKTSLLFIFGVFFLGLFGSSVLKDVFSDADLRDVCVFMLLYSIVFFGIFIMFFVMGYLDSKNTKDSIVGEIDRSINKLHIINPDEVLTPKEKVVFELLLEGMTLRQIAGELSMKYDSVNFHYKNIYRKLEVNSKIELILRYSNEK